VLRPLLFVAERQLVLIGIRTNPNRAEEEMEALVTVHSTVERLWNTDDILIMGDLNADCRYVSRRVLDGLTLRKESRFRWLIDDDVDTTTTNSDCAYDRCAQPLLLREIFVSMLATISTFRSYFRIFSENFNVNIITIILSDFTGLIIFYHCLIYLGY